MDCHRDQEICIRFDRTVLSDCMTASRDYMDQTTLASGDRTWQGKRNYRAQADRRAARQNCGYRRSQ
mgnify:CR=1 FL=1